MRELVQRLSGLLALVMAIILGYLWVNDAADDRTLTLLIAALGLFLILAIDIPALVKSRRTNGQSESTRRS